MVVQSKEICIPFQIVETMSYSSDVQAFLESHGPFYEFAEEKANGESAKENSNSETEPDIQGK